MENKISIITHRGLEPSKKDSYFESAYEAFADHIKRGFGIEFDPNFVKDRIIVFHDLTLKRLTENRDQRPLSEVSADELVDLTQSKKGRIPELSEILQLIKNSKAINAMHLNGAHQTIEKVDLLLKEIRKFPEAVKKIVIFNVRPEIASHMKKEFPELVLAPSVAHEHDMSRYNSVAMGTLLGVKDAIACKALYDWVWLDEWDLISEKGKKKFYTKETFETLRKHDYKIALVTPELHLTSPGLLGSEAHEDAISQHKLFSRIKEILGLNPNAVCTDYPEEVRKIISGI